jgi:hypothetical protein
MLLMLVLQVRDKQDSKRACLEDLANLTEHFNSTRAAKEAAEKELAKTKRQVEEARADWMRKIRERRAEVRMPQDLDSWQCTMRHVALNVVQSCYHVSTCSWRVTTATMCPASNRHPDDHLHCSCTAFVFFIAVAEVLCCCLCCFRCAS